MKRKRAKTWYESAVPGDICSNIGKVPTRCPDCEPNGYCDTCDTIDARYCEAVFEYASTCDLCSELTSHSTMTMDLVTQLGYCESCLKRARRLGLLQNEDKPE